MPRLVSASVDETVFDLTKRSHLQEARSLRLSHAVSATELRGTRPAGYASSVAQKRKVLQRHRRAASSFPLSSISHNTRKSVSRSENSNSKESVPSLPASKLDEHWTPISALSSAPSAYPTPPASEASSPRPLSACEDDGCEVVDDLPFPLSPVPLPPLKFPASSNDEGLYTPNRRATSAAILPSTPTRSRDRYISSRFSPQEPSKAFRLSKSPSQLSASEKLVRNNSATPDPFGPLLLPRVRDIRTHAPNQSLPAAALRLPRPVGTTNITTLPDPFTTQDRHASAGAVWNIGGGALGHHHGPIRSVSNGRGGFVSGGSNAPMYSSQFFDDDTSDQDLERMEARLAAALDIDQTVRILDISRSPQSPRSASTGGIGSKRKRPYVEPRTRWKYGDWMREGSQSRTYFCALSRAICELSGMHQSLACEIAVTDMLT